MKNFISALEGLQNIDNIKEIELFDANGYKSGHIINKTGTQGSIKIYNHLFLVYGELNKDAALEGLNLYCEHVADAKNNPGKHPNIDRLLNIIKTKEVIKMKII
jgi:hypothetical protein|tara:strand:+ start:4356 stop:4667 length:312 start_codon:yes stop_codon:yes gene_type:complete